jgi:hypothetical protein
MLNIWESGKNLVHFHLFVTYSFINSIWQWIIRHSNFSFTGNYLADLWYLDSFIPLKDDVLLEAFKGAVLWVIWLERNIICFNNTKCRNIKTIYKIISLVSFWCSHTGTDNHLKISLVLPQTINDLFLQVSTRALEETIGVEALVDNPLVEGQDMVLTLPIMCGSDHKIWFWGGILMVISVFHHFYFKKLGFMFVSSVLHLSSFQSCCMKVISHSLFSFMVLWIWSCFSFGCILVPDSVLMNTTKLRCLWFLGALCGPCLSS